jgi:endoplasmic reticulum-Golgi intermediate compartment protein 3
MFQYFLKIVPTTYDSLWGERIATNQYSVTEHFKRIDGPMRGLPG